MKRFNVLGLAVAVFFAAAGIACAAEIECQVKSVEGTTATLDCGGKAGAVKAGDQVKVKTGANKRREQPVGC